MKIRQIDLLTANAFVLKFHRHHGKSQGHKFSVGLFDGETTRGVAICGRPVSRRLDDGKTMEITRLCTDGVKNGCSMLYSACARISKEFGYEKIQTYILASESGISLRASGWEIEAERVGAKAWNSSGVRKRTDEIADLFETKKKYPNELKQRWVKYLLLPSGS